VQMALIGIIFPDGQSRSGGWKKWEQARMRQTSNVIRWSDDQRRSKEDDVNDLKVAGRIVNLGDML